jgi:hypothetical protein
MAVQRMVGDVESARHSQLGAHRLRSKRLPHRVIVAQIREKALTSRLFPDDVPGHLGLPKAADSKAWCETSGIDLRQWRGFNDIMYSMMSSICSGVKVMCGIVSCGDRSSARSEYSVIEGSAANSGKGRRGKVRREPVGADAMTLDAPLVGQVLPGNGICRYTAPRGQCGREYCG